MFYIHLGFDELHIIQDMLGLAVALRSAVHHELDCSINKVCKTTSKQDAGRQQRENELKCDEKLFQTKQACKAAGVPRAVSRQANRNLIESWKECEAELLIFMERQVAVSAQRLSQKEYVSLRGKDVVEPICGWLYFGSIGDIRMEDVEAGACGDQLAAVWVCPKCDKELRVTRREKSLHEASCTGKVADDDVEIVDMTEPPAKRPPPRPNYRQMLLEKNREVPENQEREAAERSRSRSPRGSKDGGGKKKKAPPVLGTKFA